MTSVLSVILVPGISGNQGETWAPADTTALGFEEYLRYNIDKKRVSTYKYPLIGNEASIFSRSGLNREASRLLEAISQLDRARNQRIILAGHDVGGILIKQVRVRNPKFNPDLLPRHLYKPLLATSLFETHCILLTF